MKPLIGVLSLAWLVRRDVARRPETHAGGPGKPVRVGSHASGGHPAKESAAADAMFMRTAAMDGMAEVEHGRLAARMRPTTK